MFTDDVFDFEIFDNRVSDSCNQILVDVFV